MQNMKWDDDDADVQSANMCQSCSRMGVLLALQGKNEKPGDQPEQTLNVS